MTNDGINRSGGTEPIEYLLGSMSGEEQASFEERLREDEGLREELAEVEAMVLALRDLPEDGWSDADPPPLAILPNARAEVAPDEYVPELPAAAEPNRKEPGARQRDRWRIPAFALSSAAILLVGLALGTLLGGNDQAAPPAEPQVISASDLNPAGKEGRSSSGSARVLRDVGGDQSLAVSVDGLPSTAPGRYYELWLMRGSKLISLGGFKVGATGRRNVEVPLPVDPADYRLIDISLENANGDPGHSAISLLRGPV